jgi:hypothetical protein
MSEKQTKIFIVVETPAESIKKDMGSLAFALGLIAPGVFMDSSAMQWAGFLVFVVWLLVKGSKGIGVHRVNGFPAARAVLDQIEQERQP